MHIYLPIAEIPVNILAIILLGGVTGILSGMFGVGGGFLVTPFLMFMGVPPAVAVATSANQIIATSVSGFSAHWRRGNVDFQIGILLLLGGLVGSSIGVWMFSLLKAAGQIDLVIALSYVFFLGTVGGLMAWESYRSMQQKAGDAPPAPTTSNRFAWIKRLPLQRHFSRSDIEMSLLAPLGVGILVGIMVSIMGIGGGFLMIPAMIYVLGMPTSVVVGTSLFQIIFTTSHVTILHALNTQSVDVVLALLLLAGSVIGAQYGTRIGARLPAEQLRIFLASLVLLVSLKLAFELFVHPGQLYVVIPEAML